MRHQAKPRQPSQNKTGATKHGRSRCHISSRLKDEGFHKLPARQLDYKKTLAQQLGYKMLAQQLGHQGIHLIEVLLGYGAGQGHGVLGEGQVLAAL